MKIAFIGLGNMGAPMARCLIAAGHEVVGFDPAAAPDDIPCADSAAQAVAGAEVAITMLPNGDILRAVAGEIHPAMDQGALHLDCSTVDVQSARDVAEAAEKAGLMAVDAPVSGGIGGAINGTLTFMGGGAQDAFAKAEPLFDIMGQKAVHCGDSGAGQAAKICNNMILGATMIATCEAFALADQLGLERQKMFDVVSTSSGYSWSMNAYCPAPGVGPESPADNDYAPGFAAALMLKDLKLSQQAAQAVGANTPMGAQAMEIYNEFVETYGKGGLDFSAILPHLATEGGTGAA
ncbi:3-hydroxyisobutyrate dehydrogenase [Thalassorhabdomicrobium marinisediminis]|uniref:3-hydroxyisobutyrate dehydrogenase n=1 Tax=Thalassorhabdomicrobium marinisediminis TaxID=2170577 RepID=UPI002492DEC0|nr:3-hydroxyisobutyrate dehydrogenase [Thalassorhabdomicrobium marinisediminis]